MQDKRMKPSCLLNRNLLILAMVGLVIENPLVGAETALNAEAQFWREQHRTIDVHQHVVYSPTHLSRAVGIMDKAGIGIGHNLSGGVVTHAPGQVSEFEKNRQLCEELYPGRFIHAMNLDYTGFDQSDFSEKAAAQVEEGFRLGTSAFKEFKRLGLYLKNGKGNLIKIDDPKLDAVWSKCGALGLPVFIHVADPKAFWKPYDASNERWDELKDHRSWWFGDPEKYPKWEELLNALNRVIEKHPKTTFICVHFANNAEDVIQVSEWLDRYPNMIADVAARIPEIGRQDVAKVREVFIRHQDRILFGTDFMVYDNLILGSGGKGPAPTDADAQEFYRKHWQWFETQDNHFAHMTPIQGNWTISAINLPTEVLRKIYFDNARKLFRRVLPLPAVQARHISEDFAVDGSLDKTVWKQSVPVSIEYQTGNGSPISSLSTQVKILWSDEFLYIGYRAPFTKLTVFEPPYTDRERIGLWERDVVEAFISDEVENPMLCYTEYQIAPTGEKLDLILTKGERDFDWNSGWQTAVKVDKEKCIWESEWKIPFKSLTKKNRPNVGSKWRINLFRCDVEHKAFLTWNPTYKSTFHVPEKFGYLEFK